MAIRVKLGWLEPLGRLGPLEIIRLQTPNYALCINAIGSSADGFATAGCLSGNTRFGISPSHFVGSSLLIHYALCI